MSISFKSVLISIIKFLGWILSAVLILFLVLVMVIRSPKGQQFIINKATEFVADKTNTKFEIGRLYLTFDGNLLVESLYVEDLKKDTLVYSEYLEISLALIPLIRGEKVDVQMVDWKGLTANVQRFSPSEEFNFTFLIDAFAPVSDTVSTPETSKAISFEIGQIILADIDLNYQDQVLGMKAALAWDELQLKMRELNLEQMVYAVESLTINGLSGDYTQFEAITQEDSSAASDTPPMPQIIVDELVIEHSVLSYKSEPDSLLLYASIGRLGLKLPKADLENRSIAVNLLQLNETKIVVESLATAQEVSSQPEKRVDFIWPDWAIDIDNVDFNNNTISYRAKAETDLLAVFDPDFLTLNKADIAIDDLHYAPGTLTLAIRNVHFEERSGFTLSQLTSDVILSNEQASFKNLVIKTNQNALSGRINANFRSIDELINQPENSSFTINLNQLKLNAKDAFYFQPTLAENELIKSSVNNNLKGAIHLSGNSKQVNIKNIDLNWGETNLTTKGSLKNPLNTQALFVDINYLDFNTKSKDIYSLVPAMDSALYIPDTLIVQGNIAGNLDKVVTSLAIKSSLGDLELDLNLNLLDSLIFDLNLLAKEVKLNQILDQPALAPVSLTLSSKGNGSDLSSLEATVNAAFQELAYNGYDLTALNIDAGIRNGIASALLVYKDSSLNAKLQTKIVLDTANPAIDLSLNLIGVALQQLGLTERDIRLAFDLEAQYEGKPDAFDAYFQVSNGISVYDYKSYPIGQIDGAIHVRDDSTNFKIDSEVLDASLISNTDPQHLITALNRQFKSYLGDITANDSVSSSANMKLNLTVRENDILDEVFFVQINKFDSMSMSMWFEEEKDSLSAHFVAPFIDIAGNTIDSLKFDLIAGKVRADVTLGWTEIVAGPLSIQRTEFTGQIANDTLRVDFLAYEQKEKLFQVQSVLSLSSDTLHYHIDPSTLIFNKLAWQIPENNRIDIASSFINFRDFILRNEDQMITAQSLVGGNEYEEVRLDFDRFELATFTSFLNAETEIANGIVGGEFTLIDLFGKTGLEADLKISALEVLENELGVLTVYGQSNSGVDYDFDLGLTGPLMALSLAGNYAATESGPVVDLNFDLEKLALTLVEQFSEGQLSQAEGYIFGEIEVSGAIGDPTYNGFLEFKDTQFEIDYLNSKFSIPNDRIGIDNVGIHFNKFSIIDESTNSFNINGDVLLKNPVNPGFDLKVKAQNFRAVNANKGDNELFYGKVFLNSDLSIKGNLNLPKIRGSFSVNEGSDLTVIVPESQLSLVEREGVVIFVNKENPDKILTRVDDRQGSADIVGIDLYTNLIVEDNSVFRVLIDERTGDNFEVSGRGDFTVGVDPTGRTTLAGRYKVSSGHYRASLYGLVKRKFSISPESVITWSGDPLDAKLDVAAVYEVKTSAGPIMATSVTSADQSTARRYNAQLPFQVYLNVEGQLLAPDLSFKLDMPEESRGELGGDVYNRLQQLNQQESELNKQVFSLLVLNRFFPASGSDGSAGGAEAIARTNVSKVLSGQLNAFSEKLLGQTGFELNFGVNSYTGDQSLSGSSGTQLDVTASKALFDERLIVQVGSEVGIEGSGQTSQTGSPLIGNVSIEYLLSENGRYRLKGFRKNEFEVIDGQLIVNGIAFLFNREFNKFREVFEKTAAEIDKYDLDQAAQSE